MCKQHVRTCIGGQMTIVENWNTSFWQHIMHTDPLFNGQIKYTNYLKMVHKNTNYN